MKRAFTLYQLHPPPSGVVHDGKLRQSDVETYSTLAAAKAAARTLFGPDGLWLVEERRIVAQAERVAEVHARVRQEAEPESVA